jgi:hypothetical protein
VGNPGGGDYLPDFPRGDFKARELPELPDRRKIFHQTVFDATTPHRDRWHAVGKYAARSTEAFERLASEGVLEIEWHTLTFRVESAPSNVEGELWRWEVWVHPKT